MIACYKSKPKHEIIHIWSAAWDRCPWSGSFLSAYRFMSHCSLPTNGLVCLFVSPPDHLLQGGLEQQAWRGFFYPHPQAPGWWNQLGGLTSCLAGAPSLATSSARTEMGLQALLCVFVCKAVCVGEPKDSWKTMTRKSFQHSPGGHFVLRLTHNSCSSLTCFGMVLFALDLGRISHESDLQHDVFESFPSTS